MKEKILYLIMGVIIGAIITTGVFMIIDKNKKQESPLKERVTSGNGQMVPPEDVDLEGAQKTIQEDGSVRYDLPNGGVLMQKQGPEGDGSGKAINE